MTYCPKEDLHNMTHAVCPLMKEWSNHESNRDFSCRKCPSSEITSYGQEVISMCYLIANNVAKKAMESSELHKRYKENRERVKSTITVITGG